MVAEKQEHPLLKRLNELLLKLEEYQIISAQSGSGKWHISQEDPNKLAGKFLLKINLPDIDKLEQEKQPSAERIAETNPIFQLLKKMTIEPTKYVRADKHTVIVHYLVSADQVRKQLTSFTDNVADKKITEAKELATSAKTSIDEELSRAEQYSGIAKEPVQEASKMSLYDFLNGIKKKVDNPKWNRSKDGFFGATVPTHIDNLRTALKNLSPNAQPEKVEKIYEKVKEILDSIKDKPVEKRKAHVNNFYKELQEDLRAYEFDDSSPKPAPRK